MQRHISTLVIGLVLGSMMVSASAQRGGRQGDPPAGHNPQRDDCGLSHFCGPGYKFVPPEQPAGPADGPNWRSGQGVKLVDGMAVQQGGTDGWGKSCWGAAMCAWRSTPNTIHVVHKPDLGFTYVYPFQFPQGIEGGVTGLAINSKDHIYAYVRSNPGQPQIFEFDQNHKFVRSFGENLSGKTHNLSIDADDNLWATDQYGDTVYKLSPEGKLLTTIGVKGQRGDWDEAAGQHLLWQPLDVAFARNGDIYIAMGHGNESPNDGAARVLHLDRNGKFVNQWFGNHNGPGKFSMAHGIAVDPGNGNVWVADREEYRIVVFDANGRFIRTIQTPNLICGFYFDPHGQLWASTGGDGQIVRLDRDGQIAGTAGEGPGRGSGQFAESNYIAMDKRGNLYVGDTSVTRVTEMVPRGNQP
jgi:sugar lactone lactonase YvrE